MGRSDDTFNDRMVRKTVLPAIYLWLLASGAVVAMGIYHVSIHISEPTRLRRISYAVFCLKKKKKKNNENIIDRARKTKDKNSRNV